MSLVMKMKAGRLSTCFGFCFVGNVCNSESYCTGEIKYVFPYIVVHGLVRMFAVLLAQRLLDDAHERGEEQRGRQNENA